MKIIVQKFGGTSLDGQERIEWVGNQVIQAKRAGFGVVVVASAPAGMTSDLLARCTQIDEHPPPRERDMLLSVGEQVSISLLAVSLARRGVAAVSLTGAQAGIYTNGDHGRARITELRAGRILKELRAGRVVVVAGYQGITTRGEITTLGRGGSDTTAVALAAALKAERCEIWTDVEGVHTGHPGLIPDAPIIAALSFDDMLEMADSGARVLKASAVELAKRWGIEIDVGSSFSRRLGSRVTVRDMDRDRVTGVTLEEDVALLTLKHTAKRTNFTLIAKFAQEGVAVKSIWERGLECGILIAAGDLVSAHAVISDHYDANSGVTATVNRDLALLSVVGAGIGFGTDVVTRAFEVFKSMQLRPEHYFFSERRISFAVERSRAGQALTHIHQTLFAGAAHVSTTS